MRSDEIDSLVGRIVTKFIPDMPFMDSARALYTEWLRNVLTEALSEGSIPRPALTKE